MGNVEGSEVGEEGEGRGETAREGVVGKRKRGDVLFVGIAVGKGKRARLREKLSKFYEREGRKEGKRKKPCGGKITRNPIPKTHIN